VTYAHKIEKAEARIDWTQPATVIGQRIRAFDPFPGAVAELDGEPLKLWRYEIDSVARNSGAGCGTVLSGRCNRHLDGLRQGRAAADRAAARRGQAPGRWRTSCAALTSSRAWLF
jgi:methionyl-tRNA formyltransferase